MDDFESRRTAVEDLAAAVRAVADATVSTAIDPAEITGGLLPDIVDLLTRTGLSASRGAARRTIGEGGAYVNNVRVEDEAFRPPAGDLIDGRFLVLRRGRKTVAGVLLEG